MTHLYILIGRYPVAVERGQEIQWAHWMHAHPKHVARTEIKPRKPLRKGNPKMLRRLNKVRARHVLVSTVFTGLNYRFLGEGAPLVFETFVQGHGYRFRWCTWEEAETGHFAILAALGVTTEE